ncbi:ABC transporter permease subunit [Corynebacterium alimapuense]|nr:ABC transporter permease subunit [Corynebacterium alimapuense]
MSPNLILHDLRERRVGILVIGFSLGVLSFFALAMSVPMADMLNSITDNLTPALEAFLGGEAPGGYVVGEVFNLIAPIAIVAYAISVGASILAGEEQTKTMSLLSAQPISRLSIFTAKAVVLILALLGAVVLFWAGLALGVWLIDVDATLTEVTAGSVHLFFLGLAFGGLSFGVAAATGQSLWATSIVGTIAVVTYFMNAMLPLAGFDAAAKISPWYYYLGSDPLNNGIDAGHLLVLAAIAAVGFAVSAWAFPRRDLKG